MTIDKSSLTKGYVGLQILVITLWFNSDIDRLGDSFKRKGWNVELKYDCGVSSPSMNLS